MQITRQLGGRKIKEVWKHENCLVVVCEDGYEMQVAWVDSQTGKPVNGEPLVMRAGLHVRAKTGVIMHRGEVGL